MDAFDRTFERLIGHEGGYVDHPSDPGGETNWGITWPTLREAIALDVVPAGSTIAGLTRSQARAIYRELFWRRNHFDELEPAVAFQVFDAAVNHGMGTAVRLMQRAAGVADDGFVGPVTLEAVRALTVTDFISLFTAERLDFWRKLSTWPTFGKGWAGRAAANLRHAAEDS